MWRRLWEAVVVQRQAQKQAVAQALQWRVLRSRKTSSAAPGRVAPEMGKVPDRRPSTSGRRAGR